VDRRVHHFGVVGAANGLSIMADKETHTLWDHISGEAFDGPLKGESLETWPVFLTNVDSELSTYPETQLFSSSFHSFKMSLMGLFTGLMGINKRGLIPPNFYRSMSKPIESFHSFKMSLMGLFTGLMGINKRGLIPPNFYRSMSKPIDPRLPKLTQGLGVIAGKHTKYYPMDQIPRGESIMDNWGKRIMAIRSGKDGIPLAIWKDTDENLMQLLSRWYGFSFTYPDCEIYELKKEKA
jgi:hypothetical protein